MFMPATDKPSTSLPYPRNVRLDRYPPCVNKTPNSVHFSRKTSSVRQLGSRVSMLSQKDLLEEWEADYKIGFAVSPLVRIPVKAYLSTLSRTNQQQSERVRDAGDHHRSWCPPVFRTKLTTSTRAFHNTLSREAACPRNRFIIENMANRPMPIPISKSTGGSGTA